MTNPMHLCGAQTRDGDPCKLAAVTGSQRCRMHGGRDSGRPIETGRYSLVHRAALQDKMQAFLSDPRPGDLTAELALMRALLQDYLDRFGDDATLETDDYGRLLSMIETVSRLVERIARIFNETALTTAEVRLLQAHLGDLVMKYVEPSKRLAFLDELASTLSSGRGSQGASLTINDPA